MTKTTCGKMIYQIAYRSLAVFPRGHVSDLDILRTAVVENQKWGVTGFLGRYNNIFLQILEGEPEQVQALMRNIQKDRRHNELELLSEGFVKERSFADWSMGYADLRDINQLEITARTAKLALVNAASRADPNAPLAALA